MSDYYIGWDVGGWNCDNNSRSRDAIVILDTNLQIIGTPWRGNLRVTINEAAGARDYIVRLFRLCRADTPAGSYSATIGIDTPLGFSESFINLSNYLKAAPSIGESGTNPYLFRATERYLITHGINPLSAIKDMIGSQATKGMHALGKFTPELKDCGVWSDGEYLTAIEVYPSPCRHSAVILSLRGGFQPLGHDDKEDALTCALIAYLYSQTREKLVAPPSDISNREGWIWVPQDVFE